MQTSFVKQQKRLLSYLSSDAQKRYELLLAEYPPFIHRLPKKVLAAYLGVSRAEHTAYVVEELGDGELPIAYRLYLEGPRAGHLVPIQAWYERDPSEDRGSGAHSARFDGHVERAIR